MAPRPSQHFDFTAGGRQQPLDDLDCRCFSRAIRSQQPKALADLDFQIQTAHGFDGWPSRIAVDKIRTSHSEHMKDSCEYENDTRLTSGASRALEIVSPLPSQL